ncbi:MAG TPA: hypothetical protein VIK03_07100 [Thermoleophilia bacterium]
MTHADDKHLIAAATAALPAIVAALDPENQPAGGSWVAFSVRAPLQGATGETREVHRSWYTWRHDAPLEDLDEATYLGFTQDPNTGVAKVPVWSFVLEPLADDAWRLRYSFGAPLRMWMGDRAGNRVMGYAVTYVARSVNGDWELAFEDVLAG